MQARAEPLKSLAGRLRHSRQLRGLGCRELDRFAGLSQGVTSGIETGRRHRVEATTIIKLANALKVQAQWLTDGVEPMDETRDTIQARHGAVDQILKLLSGAASLEHVISEHPKRWHPAVIQFGRTLSRTDETYDEAGWLTRLDEVQRKTMTKRKA